VSASRSKPIVAVYGMHYAPAEIELELLRTQDHEMKIKSLALALVLLGAAGCKTLSRGSSAADQNQPTVLQVDNQGFVDMDVFTLRSSQRVRLGTAPG